jgi:hypothetical protein
MARRGKFIRLVDQFVATVEQLGGTVDPVTVAEELQARIDATAAQLRVTPQTVLRTYIPEDWGIEAAAAMMADIRKRERPDGPPEHMAVRVAARLQAALGQVLIYAASNDDQQQPAPILDLKQVGEAVAGLGLAIQHVAPTSEYVTIGADTAMWTRTALETLCDQLRLGTWTFCPCGEDHGQRETDQQVLAAIKADLLFLPPGTSSTLPGAD